LRVGFCFTWAMALAPALGLAQRWSLRKTEVMSQYKWKP
jgi:hypothetical protein